MSVEKFQSNGFRIIMGIIIGVAVFIITFVTAAEIAFYSDYGFYEKEYKKYNVNHEESIINMEMEELMRVTEETMLYLRGKRPDLDIQAEIDSKQKEYYNDIDKSHMKDVQGLFLEGLEKRAISVGIVVVATVLLVVTGGIGQAVITICDGIRGTFALILGFVGCVAFYAIMNFQHAFTVMHLMLFDNDNWLLDPSISRLINMFPEGFFMDMGIRWLLILIFTIFFIFVLCFLGKRGMIKKIYNNEKISGGTYEQG